MTLQEKQWELGGVVFGPDSPVEVREWTPGSPNLRTNDQARPGADGVRMGRDYKGEAVWSFSLYTNGEDEDEAWASLAELAMVWDSEEARAESDIVLPLNYRLAGRDRTVYGRPRRWTPTPTTASVSGMIGIEADFVLAYPLVFGATETRSIPILPPIELDAGAVAPFVFPVDFAAGATTTSTSILIEGDASTPISITFYGPTSDGAVLTDAAVRVGAWTAALLDPVVKGDPVTIDARPWVTAATRQSGGGVRLNPRVTRISKMWLPPGNHAVTFTGIDPTSSSSVVISWADAYKSPR